MKNNRCGSKMCRSGNFFVEKTVKIVSKVAQGKIPENRE